MRRTSVVLCALALILALLPSGVGAQVPPYEEPVDYVDPMIGTLAGGFSFPGPAAPFGMVQLSPDTEGEFAYTGYQYGDTSIRGFSHHHIQSMGVHSNGDLPFMPTVGPVLHTDPRSWMSPFDHATEEASAGYYRVLLERYGILAELTAGERVGMHRYTFPPGPQSNVIFDVGHSAKGWHPYGPSTNPSSFAVRDDGTVVGTSTVGDSQSYSIHFAAQFDSDITGFGAWDSAGPNSTPVAGKRQSSGSGAGGYVTFDTTLDRDVLVKVGISFVSQDNALANLKAEKPDWDFDALRDKTRDAWNDALSTIRVAGGTEAEKISFYTALYHAQHHPNIYQDHNGEYMGHDDRVHVADGYVHYANFSLWDTYRGENQLLALIQPDRYTDMMRSLLDIYEEAGRFPQWAMNDGLPDYMEGDPVQPTIVDGYCRGLLPEAEIDAMYAALRSQAQDEPMASGVGKRSATESGYQEYVRNGYMSGTGADASGNFEYAIADFSLSLMADSLGLTNDAEMLRDRALNYRHLINPATGFAHPRDAGGNFIEGYTPEQSGRWKEGTGWQYTWLAPQDLGGLFDIVGGHGRAGMETVRERLDTYFSTDLADSPAVAEMQKTITLFGLHYEGNQHAPSNEHDIHAPYLYDYAGQPWKTQKIMRGYQALFRPTPDGLPGNDDLGSMSAWFVWSALGFYPIAGGAPMYVIGSPMFEGATIRPVDSARDMHIEAPGASFTNKYIGSAALGGAALDRPWFTHSELVEAAGDPARPALVMNMAAEPNESWGAAPAAAPPSLSTHALSAFGCPKREAEEPQPIATVLVYTGETRAQGDTVALAATLSTAAGDPVEGAALVFTIAGQTVTATTDATGRAGATVTVPDHGRSQEVRVSYAGDDRHLPSQTTATVTWGRPKP